MCWKRSPYVMYIMRGEHMADIANRRDGMCIKDVLDMRGAVHTAPRMGLMFLRGLECLKCVV